jgi:hypothetical protein
MAQTTTMIAAARRWSLTPSTATTTAGPRLPALRCPGTTSGEGVEPRNAHHSVEGPGHRSCFEGSVAHEIRRYPETSYPLQALLHCPLASVSLEGRPFRAENRRWSLSADAVVSLIVEVVH